MPNLARTQRGHISISILGLRKGRRVDHNSSGTDVAELRAENSTTSA
jgi:hypothetical protein